MDIPVMLLRYVTSALPAPWASVVSLLLTCTSIPALWKLFEKAGQPVWASLVPIYRDYVLFKTARVDVKLFLLSLLCNAGQLNVFWSVAASGAPTYLLWVLQALQMAIVLWMQWKLGGVFRKGVAFRVGLMLCNTVFLYLLAFGSAAYPQPEKKPSKRAAERAQKAMQAAGGQAAAPKQQP